MSTCCQHFVNFQLLNGHLMLKNLLLVSFELVIFDSFQDKLYYVGNEPLNECFVSRGTLSDNAFCKQWPLENIKETLPRIVSF